MYPQGTALNRAPSVPTVHSIDRSLSGANRPTHPYGMYPQTMVDSTGTEALLAGSADIASIGFPGLEQQYVRRQGPDGEGVDDIIGPDGHSEQLPPYSLHPVAPPPKPTHAPGAETASLIAAEPHAESNLVNVRLPRAQGSPHTDSDLVNAPTRPPGPESYSTTSLTDRLIPVSNRVPGNIAVVSTAGDSERCIEMNEKYRHKRRDHKFFGWLPCWAVCVGVAILIVLAAVLGGAIGRTIHRQPTPQPAGTTRTASPFL